MALQDILLRKLEYQIFAWQKEVRKARAEAVGPRKPKMTGDADRIGKIDEDPSEYVRRLERNIEAARKKITEVREADQERLLELKKQLSDWMD